MFQYDDRIERFDGVYCWDHHAGKTDRKVSFESVLT